MSSTRTRRPGASVLAVAARLAVVVLGLYTGVLGAAVHRQRTDLGVLVLPWGLVLGVLAAALVAAAAGRLVRAGGAWFGLGWTLVLLLQGLGGSGSYLVGSDGWGWAFMLVGLGAVLAVVVLDQVRHRAPPRLGR